MRNNIICKALFRQMGRAILLFLLITVSTFMFVFRAVEYLIVSEQIDEISRGIVSVGFLQDPEYLLSGDISEGIPILEEFEGIAYFDRRRFLDGVMLDHHAADVFGFARHSQFQPREHTAFFYGTFLGFGQHRRQPTSTEDFIQDPPDRSDFNFGNVITLEFMVDTKLAGLPEHIYEGQRVTLYFEHRGAGATVTWTSLADAYEPPEAPCCFNAFLPILQNFDGELPQIGDRFFVKSAFRGSPPGQMGSLPIPTMDIGDNQHFPLPLFEDIDPYGRTFDRFLIPLGPDEEVDFTLENLLHIPNEIALANQNERSLFLTTTRDMNNIPAYIGLNRRIVSGRAITNQDYLEENNVIVVNQSFANRRGVVVGDIIRMKIPQNQYVVNQFTTTLGGGTLPERSMRTFPEDLPDEYLSLEVVGTFRFDEGGGEGVGTSRHSPMYAFVPDSIIPEINHSVLLLDDFDEIYEEHGYDVLNQFIEWYEAMYAALPQNRLSPLDFSFVLSDSRYEEAFYLENRAEFEEIGLILAVIPARASQFWVSIGRIMAMLVFNLVLFSITLFFVLIISAFLFLKSKSKDFAIMRAFGLSRANILLKTLAAILVILIPAVFLGGLSAWHFGINTAYDTLYNLRQVFDGFNVVSELDNIWLYSILGIVAFSFILTMLIGILTGLSKPVLELLQGQRAKTVQASTEEVTITKQETEAVLNKSISTQINSFVPTNKKGKILFGWLWKSIVRQPLRSGLLAATAILFSVTLIWLHASIVNTQNEAQDLLYSTIVTAEARLPDEAATHFQNNPNEPGFLSRVLADFVLDSPYVLSYYLEGAWTQSFLIAGEGTQLPEDWEEQIGFDPTINAAYQVDTRTQSFWRNSPQGWVIQEPTRALNTVMGVSSLDDFIEVHSNRFVQNLFGSMDIEFAEGFDINSFGYAGDEPVTVILPHIVMESRGLELGDSAIFAYRRRGDFHWRTREAIVIGSHNSHIYGHVQDVVVLPLEILLNFLHVELRYTNFSFNINPIFNSQLEEITAHFDERFSVAPSGFMIGFGHQARAYVRIFNDELTYSIAAIEQTLLLLELFYPVALVASILIGIGLSVLIALQSAKNISLLYALGIPKKKAGSLIVCEQAAIFIAGAIISVGAILLLGWIFEFQSVLALGIYILGATAGSIFAVLTITKKPLLEMLQLRE